MQNLEISRSYGLTFDGQSMLRLSFSTAILVATFLSIPDALAIMPTTKELPALIVRICGLWLSAFIQWQLAFLCILSFLSWLNGPIVVSDSGIKLSRFSRIIAWSEISALTCQSGPVFFKWLPFVEPVARLNLFVGENKKRLKTKNLDSLLFKTQDFRKLFLIISKR
ncbi:MAG: hypothetical protein K8F91_12900, partial [Candidatus Obscuribacterales bacterium]|nr:hypothetical protein [Candidatus Obscuribacterales bacterium]